MSTANTPNTDDDDFSLDEIEDLPEFKIPPTGAYLMTLEKGIVDIEHNDIEYFTIPMTIKEVMEVNEKSLDDGEVLPKEGDIVTVWFSRKPSENQKDQTKNYGLSNFKKFFAPVADRFGVKKLSEIRGVAEGLELLVILKRSYDRKADRHNLKVERTEVV
jgi:hypothetical protein